MIPLDSFRSRDVVVIGGGIVGLSTAYSLLRRGVDVAVVEREDIGAGSSGRTVGGVRLQARSKWQLPLMVKARSLWQGLSAELGESVDYVQRGSLFLARTEDALEFYRSGPDGVEEQSRAGLDTRIVTVEEVRQLAPIAEGPIFVGGRYCPLDGAAHPQKTLSAYAHAIERLGGSILRGRPVIGLQMEGHRVRGVRTDQGGITARWVVNAAGPWAAEVGSWGGVALPITPVRGQVLLSQPCPPVVNPYLFHGDVEGQRLFIRQRPDGQIVTGLGNPLQEPGWSTDVDRDFEAQLRRRLRLLTPSIADIPAAATWGGLYEVTPDTEPIIDLSEEPEGFVLACGFSAQGFGPAPAVGALLAEWIQTGKRPELLAPFKLARFEGETAGNKQLLAEMMGTKKDE